MLRIFILIGLLFAYAPDAMAGLTSHGKLTINDGADTTCLDIDTDEIYHDTNCNGTKDGGEEFIDQVGGGAESDPTLTDDTAVTIGDGTGADQTITIDSTVGAGSDPTIVYDHSEGYLLVTTPSITSDANQWRPSMRVTTSNGNGPSSTLYESGSGSMMIVGSSWDGYSYLLARDTGTDSGGLAFWKDDIMPAEEDGSDFVQNAVPGSTSENRVDNKIDLGTSSYRFKEINGYTINAATSFTIGSAGITEAELEILDGLTATTAELEELTDGSESTLHSHAGGGSSPLTTKGDVYTYDTDDQRLAVGTDGQILSADSAEATGLKWIDAASTGDQLAATFYDNTGGQTVGTSRTVLNLDATIGDSSGGVISLASDVVTVTETAYYQITWDVVMDLATGTRDTMNIYVQLDSGGGFADIDGTMTGVYGRIANESNSTSGTIVVSLTANDDLRISADCTAASACGTVADGTRFSIIQLKAPAGAGGAGLWTDLEPNLEPNDDGDGIQINDSGGTDYVVQSHDGTDYNFVGTNTTQYTFDLPLEIGGTAQSTITEGLVVNNASGSDEDDDFIVNSATATAVEVDAGDETITFGVPLKFATTVPKKRLYIPITGGTCRLTTGCFEPVLTESTTNDVNYWAAAFGDDADDYWQAQVILPENYDGSTFTAAIEWVADSDSTSGGVSWFVQLMTIADDDAIDTAFGTAIESADDWTAAGDYLLSAETAAITASGTPAGGDKLYIQVYRDVSDADDDLAGGTNDNANMLGMYLTFGIDALSTED